MSATKPTVGWIGLGKIGTPMAQQVQAAGYPLVVYNRTAGKLKPLVEAGAKAAGGMTELAAQSDVVISMISDDPALREVGAAVKAGIKKGALYIDMSTVSPATSAEVAGWINGAGASYLRAPVSGSTMLASKGALTIFVSGPKPVFEAHRPIFEAMGKAIHHVGPAEEARHLKLAINLMIGVTAATIGEALAFGEGGGMEWRQMIDIINASVVASPLTGYKAEMLKNRDFAPAFTAAQMVKDFDLALETARAANVPMPVTAMVRQFMGAMVAMGRGEKDFFSYVTLMEDLAGLSARAKNKD